MLIGAHVSPAGGLAGAIERGERARLPRDPDLQPVAAHVAPDAYSEDDVAAFREAMAASAIDAVLIHAVYLLNCASEDREIRAKIARLADPLAARRRRRSARRRRPAPRLGQGRRRRRRDRARRRDDPRGARRERGLPAAPREHGRRRRHARALVRRARARCSTPAAATRGSACASTRATCSPPATTSARRRGSTRVLDDCDAARSARGRIGSLHLNDSQTPLGSNRDRHANIGKGELGERRLRARSCRRAGVRSGLPCVLETPGENREGPPPRKSRSRWSLRERGTRRRAGADGPLARSPYGDATPSRQTPAPASARARARRAAPACARTRNAVAEAHAARRPGARVDLEHDLRRPGVRPRSRACSSAIASGDRSSPPRAGARGRASSSASRSAA